MGTVGKGSVAQCGTPRSFIRYFCEQQMRLAWLPWLMSVVLAMAGCLSLTQFPAGGERVQLGHSYHLGGPKPLIARGSSNNLHVGERRRGLASRIHCYMIHVQAIDRATRRRRPLAPRLKVGSHSGSLRSRAARRHQLINCCVAATLQRLIKKTCTRILKLGLALLDSDRTAAAGLHHTDCFPKQSRRLSWRIGGNSKKRT